MNSGGGLVSGSSDSGRGFLVPGKMETCIYNNGLIEAGAAMEVDYVEKDPRGRYIRYPEILGKGTFKKVYGFFSFHTFFRYKAFDRLDGIEVAWNRVRIDDVLQSSDDFGKLYSEVLLLRSLKHDNVIKFFDSWIDIKKKTLNMITELFTSGSLRQEFIEKCLVPAKQRLSAMELLKDPFLDCENPKNPTQVPRALSRLNESVDTSNGGDHPVVELHRKHQENEFSLQGTKNDNNSVSLTMRIADPSSQARNIHFTFYPDRDTAPSVANEMVEQLDLVEHDATFIAEFINNLISKIIPGWKPSSAYCSHEGTKTHGTPSSKQPSSGCLSDGGTNTHDSPKSNTDPPEPTNMPVRPVLISVSEHGSLISKDSEVSLESEPGSFIGSGSSFADLNIGISKSRGLSSNGSFLSLCECGDKVKARIELEAIETRYKQWCQEMKRVREKGVEATRKRCITTS
ncbi:Protein kinase, catalytic domain-containing protein [Cynara cardunculus var. scolymus]|uniref:non-specific serine/threonine protein kinase n=1 Tax=Cynara cardunculus var. scolymus TaxID=59895 RepID=A0A118JY15_CYNCS|nr:Protein kinase, catalytic domain-containing protein [Cynara cardunculus var. scolymus]